MYGSRVTRSPIYDKETCCFVNLFVLFSSTSTFYMWAICTMHRKRYPYSLNYLHPSYDRLINNSTGNILIYPCRYADAEPTRRKKELQSESALAALTSSKIQSKTCKTHLGSTILLRHIQNINETRKMREFFVNGRTSPPHNRHTKIYSQKSRISLAAEH